mmetsp:Transcript_3711/g.5061  ORF Transcript_3711/g.5061 Transcript_3711/m.5061 type:complete len:460 (-) Transcript_3711:264-1643(-)
MNHTQRMSNLAASRNSNTGNYLNASLITIMYQDDPTPQYVEMDVRKLYKYVMNTIQQKNAGKKAVPSRKMSDVENAVNTSACATYRERLGGYLHPRDMRRLMTPFGESNEPAIIVRRHVILLNIDPLKAIVLRDRLLVFVPEGSDSILLSLEKRLRLQGDIDEFNDYTDNDGDEKPEHSTIILTKEGDHLSQGGTEGDSQSYQSDDFFNDEREDIGTRNWVDRSFELLAVDSTLDCVSTMMRDEVTQVENEVSAELSSLRSGSREGSFAIHEKQESLRKIKEKVQTMLHGSAAFVRALNLCLNEEEDLALMNLSRLISHPHLFIQPVDAITLQEESDEPEIILEAYVQHGQSSINALTSLLSKIESIEDAVSMKLDTKRNQLLYINTFVSVLSTSISACSLVGSIFGMNLTNHLEDSDSAFVIVLIFTLTGGVMIMFGLMFIFVQTSSFHYTDSLKGAK